MLLTWTGWKQFAPSARRVYCNMRFESLPHTLHFCECSNMDVPQSCDLHTGHLEFLHLKQQWLGLALLAVASLFLFVRRLKVLSAARPGTAEAGVQTSLPALVNWEVSEVGLLDAGSPLPASPDSSAIRAYNPDAAKSYRRTSMEQLLLPKPTYSALPEHGNKKLVFVVDGEPGTQDFVSGLLEGHPEFYVASAQSGEDALMQLQQLPYLPNAVLLAKQLPGVTGLQVCHVIRKAYTVVELPLIMLLPPSAPHSAIEACMEAGANDCIIKPIGQAELLSRLNTHIMLPQLAAAEADRSLNMRLLEAMLPPRIIERLKTGSKVIAEQHEQVTILFSDIVSFTTMSHELPTEFIINMLEELFSEFDACCDKHGVYKVETIGDAYMCVAGHEGESDDHALRMLGMAESMLQATERVGKLIGHDLQIRIGLHTGPAYSGVVGRKCPRYCFFGDTVNTASRMESSSFPMCVHFSQATKVSMERAWMLRSYANSAGGAEDEGGDSDRNSRGYRQPQCVSLGARYQKGKGLVTSHLLRVGNYREAIMNLGLPDPDSDDVLLPSRDMQSALMKATASAVAATMQSQARKALSANGIVSSRAMSSMDGSSSGGNLSPFRPRSSLDVSSWTPSKFSIS